MEVIISGRHMEVTEAMENHVQAHIEKLPRFDDQIRRITVTLSDDSGEQCVEAIAKCHKATLVANASSHSIYASIEDAFSKLERRVARFHDRLVSKNAREAHRASESARRRETDTEE